MIKIINIKIGIIIVIFFFSSIIMGQNRIANQIRLGEAYIASGELEKAEAIYERLNNENPNNQGIITKLNNVYNRLKKYSQSISLLKKVSNIAPQNVEYLIFLGNTFYEAGSRDSAFISWDKATQINPYKKENYLLVAKSALDNRAFNKAIEILEQGKNHFNDKTFFSYDLAKLYVFTNQFRKAAQEYCSILILNESNLSFVLQSMESYINTEGAFEESLSVIDALYEESEEIIFLKLKAALFVKIEKYQEAYKVIIKIDDKDKNGAAIYNFAGKIYQHKNFGLAEQAYNLIIKKYPNSPFLFNSKVGYAKTLKAALDKRFYEDASWKPFSIVDKIHKEYFEIIKIYEEILLLKPDKKYVAEINYRKGKIYFEKLNGFDKAKNLFDETVLQNPFSPFAVLSLIEKGKILILENKLLDAEKVFDKILKECRSLPENKELAFFLNSKIKFWEGEFESAANILNNIIKNYSGNYANDALQLQIIITSFKKDSLNLALYAEADKLIEQKKYFEAEKKLKTIMENKTLFLLNDFSALLYSEILISSEKYEQAIKVLQQLSESKIFSPFADKVFFLLGQIYQYGLQDKEQAENMYKKILEKFPKSLYLNNSIQKIISFKKNDIK